MQATSQWTPIVLPNQKSKHHQTMIRRPAMEASKLTAGMIDSSGNGVPQAMLIDFCNDDKILKAHIPEVSSSIMFQKGYVPTDDGLFSEKIFGVSPEERKRKYAYIDLKMKFFHPYIFELLDSLGKNTFGQIATGQVCGYIDPKTKELKVIKDPTDPNFNEDHTGIPWLIEHYHEYTWHETDAITRKDKLQLLSKLKDEDLFISKYLVVPIFYRDRQEMGGKISIPEVNYTYNKLIQFSRNIDDDIFQSYNNGLYYKIQMLMVSLRKYGQSLIAGKRGHYHQALLGKSIDYGSRDVISVPVMNDMERPEDNPIDIFHTGVPLGKCLVIGYPFISKYCMQFFEDNFKNANSVMVYENKDGTIKRVGMSEIKDQLQIYTKNFIDKQINRYKNTFADRFEPIKIYFKDGSTSNYYYTGFGYPTTDENAPGASSIMKRPFTWTDLFYLAAMDTLSDKYVYVTRYPLTSFSGIFPSQCVPLSTIKTTKVTIAGREYPNYPVVEVGLAKDKVSTKFIDTLTMSNLFLSAIGGDYDGDQCSIKLCYTLEANKEAHDLCHSMKHFLNTQGDMIRNVGNEAYLTFYNMTRYD